MDKTYKRKRNGLIALAICSILCVFAFVGCVGSVLSGSGNSDYAAVDIPRESFAIIPICGTIQATPESSLDPTSYNHSAIMEYVDQLMNDNTNYGIMLRVNSGGGTVYHSDEMYLKLMEYKETTGRPIYAYFEDTAASGAYYISCAADRITGNRNGWTGSIGVIISYTDMSGLYDKLGLKEVIIASGNNKGMGHSATPLTDEQIAIYQSLVDESYEQFVNIVAKARNMDVGSVKALADGRVYTAAQAVENGLMDRTMTYEEAVAEMQNITGVVGYEKTFPSSVSFLDYLFAKAERVLPKSDMQQLEEKASSPLNGVPLYYYQK